MNAEINGDKRDKWQNKTEFVLSSLGYAIGIGNVWRFPYLCYRSGGGAFLIPYLFMLVTCGIPLYFMETSLGQFSSSGCLTVFLISPLFKGAGMAMIIVNLIVTTYFVTIYSYPLLFLYHSFNSVLPWSHCNNSWNSLDCIQLSKTTLFDNSSKVKSSAEEFFNYEILRISPGIQDVGTIVWPLFIANLVAWVATYLCMSNGIRSIGKAVYFTSTFPFLILFVLLLRGLTLPGAMKGVYFYLYPQWDKLINFKIWCDSAVQIFLSLGPGWGGVISIASHNQFGNNNQKDSIIIPVCNSLASILAGFVVFSVLGFMSYKTNIPVSAVATGGPGLAFITYPEAISLLPWSNLWAILFFLMLFFSGLSSVFVSTEAIITSLTDENPKLRSYTPLITFVVCCIMWICSTIFSFQNGMYWLALFDWYSASISIMLISIVEVMIVGWIYGADRFVKDIQFMIQSNVSWVWQISWSLITPLILITMLVVTINFNTEISYGGVSYPEWAVKIGWTSCYTSMACIPVYMGYHLLYQERGDCIKRISKSVAASPRWGPADLKVKFSWTRKVKLNQLVNDTIKESDCHFYQELTKLNSGVVETRL